MTSFLRTKLAKYYLVYKLAIQDIFQYRLDFLMSTAKYSFMVLMMSLVWIAVGKEGNDLALNQTETVRYFFFAAILYTLSNFHTNYIEDDIRLGGMNRFLLKPIAAYGYYFNFELAKGSLATFVKLVTMLPTLWLLGFGFSVPVQNIALVTLFIPFIFIFSYSMFSLISGMAFWINEAYAIRWAATIFLRFLSGLLVPISFMPQLWQQISFWLPFQHLAFTPIQLIQSKIDLSTALLSLAILMVWTVVFNLLRFFQWRAGYFQYEGTGI